MRSAFPSPSRPLPRLPGLLLACLLLLPAPALAEMKWQELRPGLEFGFLLAEASTRAGSPRIAALRVDPERMRFRVLAAVEGQKGRRAGEWRKLSGALAVFNAGQFAADRSYLGLLIQDGRQRGRLMGHLEALFLAEPEEPGLPLARVLDLHYTPFQPQASPYRQAAQSLMLLDRFGQIRVRKSEKIAHRTLVAQDGRDRVLILVTEGRHTLWELAKFVSEAGLGLREVMCMDGGPEAQLDLAVDSFAYQQYGGPVSSSDLPLPWPTANLPAALAIFPR